MHVAVLDCTLRDGGCVNNFNFSNSEMIKVKNSVENAGTEFVELGYLDSVKGKEENSSIFMNEECIEYILLEQKRPNIKYFAMIDCGKFDACNLPLRSENTLDGIRLCFHKKQYEKALSEARVVLDKGYELFLQPMITTRYSDEEVKELIKAVNTRLPEVRACYIVDSFGALNTEEFAERLSLFDSYLNVNICIGIHIHNNMNYSMDIIKRTLRSSTKHDLIIDSTMLGIGKGAGNPVLREVLGMCNRIYEKKYEIQYIDETAEEIIKPLHDVFSWGYSKEYELCAKYRVTPSYLKCFREHEITDIKDLENLISNIKDDKKDSFDKMFAERLLKSMSEAGE